MSLPLVLVHGWGMNAASWQPVQQLAQESRVVHALDLPGHGEAHAQHCPEQLDELVHQVLAQVPEVAIWCGWSLGALVAMRAALLAPERIHGLLLIAATPHFVRADDWPQGTDLSLFEQFVSTMETNPQPGWRRFLLLTLSGDPDARRHLRDLTGWLAERGATAPQAWRAGLQILATTDLRQQLGAIRQPTRLLAGRGDQICAPAATAWLSETQGWPLRLVEAGHAPHLTHPHLVLQQIEEIELELRAA